jgi:hypothetical protein
MAIKNFVTPTSLPDYKCSPGVATDGEMILLARH